VKIEKSTRFHNFHHDEKVSPLTGIYTARNFLSKGEIRERKIGARIHVLLPLKFSYQEMQLKRIDR